MAIPKPKLRSRQAASSVICLPEYDWMINSKDQTPCLVTSWAVVPCRPNGEIVNPIVRGIPYGGPASSESDEFRCRCNRVVYSLHAACAVCQGYPGDGGIRNFTFYTRNCPPGITRDVYPMTIPSEIAIPGWAYLPLGGNDRFNESAAAARASQNPPESTRSAVPSSTSSGAPANSSNARSVVGPAIGGAIGGLVALLLAGAAILLYLRGRRSKARSRKHAEVGGGLVAHDSNGRHHTDVNVDNPHAISPFPLPQRSPEMTTRDVGTDTAVTARGRSSPQLATVLTQTSSKRERQSRRSERDAATAESDSDVVRAVEWRSEMAALREEVTRMREAQDMMDEAPPAYHDDTAAATRSGHMP